MDPEPSASSPSSSSSSSADPSRRGRWAPGTAASSVSGNFGNGFGNFGMPGIISGISGIISGLFLGDIGNFGTGDGEIPPPPSPPPPLGSPGISPILGPDPTDLGFDFFFLGKPVLGFREFPPGSRLPTLVPGISKEKKAQGRLGRDLILRRRSGIPADPSERNSRDFPAETSDPDPIPALLNPNPRPPGANPGFPNPLGERIPKSGGDGSGIPKFRGEFPGELFPWE